MCGRHSGIMELCMAKWLLVGIWQLGVHGGHCNYGVWIKGHVVGSFGILPHHCAAVLEILPLHPNISRQCNLSCKSVGDDGRKENKGGYHSCGFTHT